jgi:hypothetical protein
MIDPITKQPIRAKDLCDGIKKIKAHIEAAPDEATEIAYRGVLQKWQDKLAQVLKANPPPGF